MAAVRVIIDLPYFFLLPTGEYVIGAEGSIFLTAALRHDVSTIPRGSVASQGWAKRRLFAEFHAADEIDLETATGIAHARLQDSFERSTDFSVGIDIWHHLRRCSS